MSNVITDAAPGIYPVRKLPSNKLPNPEWMDRETLHLPADDSTVVRKAHDVIVIGSGYHRPFTFDHNHDPLVGMYPHVVEPLNLKFKEPVDQNFVSDKMLQLLRRGVPGLKCKEESDEPQQG